MPLLVHRVGDTEDIGARADVVLGRRIPGLSRRVARALGLAGKLEIDGRPAPPSTPVALGQELVLRAAPPPEAAAEPPPLRVLRASASLIYVAKPAGLPTHRLRPDEPPALADLVAARFPECRAAGEDPREAGLLHRLDRPTSGVVALARDRPTWLAGRRAFTAGEATKHYAAIGGRAADTAALAQPTDAPSAPLAAELAAELAAVFGELDDLPTSAIDAPLGHGRQRAEVALRGDGLPATTLLQRLAERGDRALFLLRLITGRRHQARVHLAALGWPLLGDRTYGGDPAERLYLHAWRLDLGRAIVGEPPVVDPLPADFFTALGLPG